MSVYIKRNVMKHNMEHKSQNYGKIFTLYSSCCYFVCDIFSGIIVGALRKGNTAENF